MKWEDEGIILNFKSFSESKYIVHILTKNNGRHKGIFRKSSKELAKIQLGNAVFVRWNARLSDQMGTFMVEVNDIPYVRVFNNPERLLALSWGCQLLDMALPERHIYEDLYQLFSTYLSKLHLPNFLWLPELIRLEFSCLTYLGFGFDWSQCALCGISENLIYVSPNTGRASCQKCGQAYKNKLLLLPEILLNDKIEESSEEQIEKAYNLTGFFLKNIIPDVFFQRPDCFLARRRLREYIANAT